MVTLLLERGANVNLPPSEKYTSALQAAINMSNTQFIDTLLDAGADINANDPRFGTALTAAAIFRSPLHLSKLLARGADPHLSGGKYGLVEFLLLISMDTPRPNFAAVSHEQWKDKFGFFYDHQK